MYIFYFLIFIEQCHVFLCCCNPNISQIGINKVLSYLILVIFYFFTFYSVLPSSPLDLQKVILMTFVIHKTSDSGRKNRKG